MKVIKIDLQKDYAAALEEAVRVLRLGGTVVYPTDTVYGLGANACDALAVNDVFKIKNRPRSKPLPVLVRNLVWAKELVCVDARIEKVLQTVWPGQVTVVLSRRDYLVSAVSAGRNSVGLRQADYLFTDQLLARLGYPLTATSANLSGEGPTNNIDQIIERFSRANHRPTLILDAGILPKAAPSTVLDLSAGCPRVLRIGPSRPDQLLKLLNFRPDSQIPAKGN